MATPKENQIYPKWKVGVVNNLLIFQNQEAFDQHLIPYEGNLELELILRPIRKDRSRQEEKYYHAVVVKLVAEAMEITRPEAHDFLKGMWLKVEESKELPDGRTIRWERIKSTTELSDKEYREYWKQIQQWAALPTQDHGLAHDSGLELYIPDPNEVDYDQLA